MTVPVASAWLRGARRRPARALVVVLTLSVMTIATGAALVAADQLERLFVEDARAEWGQVHVEVRATQDGVFSLQRARFLGVETGASALAWSPRLILPAVLRSDAGGTEPDALVLGLPAEDQSFGPLTSVAGTDAWLGLGQDEVIVNERAAERLGLAVGDSIELVVGVPQVVLRDEADDRIELIRKATSATSDFTVAGIVADTGTADLHRTPNVLLRLDRLQRLVGLDGRVNVLHLTAADETATASRQLLRDVDGVARVFDMDADEVLSHQLAIAEDESGQFQSILLTLALLVIAAAAIATSQMMTALAEDRSGEIGVLRTIGVTRTTIRWLVTGEAVGLGLVASAAGLWASLPAADLLAGALADHFAQLAAGRGREQVLLAAHHDPAVLATAAVIVLVTAALAGRAAGRRLAEVDVDVLLRGPIERLPERPLPPRRPLVLALVGALVMGMGLAGGPASDALRFVGLILLGVGWWTHRRRAVSDRRSVDQRFAFGGLLFSGVGAALLADFGQGFETGFAILVAAGLVAVSASAVLLVPRFQGVMRLVRLYAPRGAWQVALRTAGSYAQESPGRTARLHATFGVVLFLAAALHVLGNAQQLPTDRQDGGFDVIARSVVGLDPPALRRLPGAASVVAMPSAMIAEDVFGAQAADAPDAPIRRLRYPARLVATTVDLVETQRFALADALDEYPTSRAALAAVVREPDKAVVDRYALPPGARVGDDIVLDIGPGLRRFQLIAVLDTFLLDAAFVNSEEFHRLVPSPGANVVLATATAGTTPEELARSLEDAHRDQGLTAKTVAVAADDVVAVNRTFTDVFALMLLCGLAVAIVAVAASLARTASERAPTLAMLRVIGLPRWALAMTLAAEPVVVALAGSIAGLGAGLVVLRLLFLVGFPELAFVIDISRAAAAGAALTAMLVLTCVLTAWPASGVSPAEHAD